MDFLTSSISDNFKESAEFSAVPVNQIYGYPHYQRKKAYHLCVVLPLSGTVSNPFSVPAAIHPKKDQLNIWLILKYKVSSLPPEILDMNFMK